MYDILTSYFKCFCWVGKRTWRPLRVCNSPKRVCRIMYMLWIMYIFLGRRSSFIRFSKVPDYKNNDWCIKTTQSSRTIVRASSLFLEAVFPPGSSYLLTPLWMSQYFSGSKCGSVCSQWGRGRVLNLWVELEDKICWNENWRLNNRKTLHFWWEWERWRRIEFTVLTCSF